MIERKSGAGISGSTLKIIAMVAMIIDHIGAVIWNRLPGMGYVIPDVMNMDMFQTVYRLMRNIGRTAFPIFCFLLVEGFFHTSSRFKYAGRLMIFALVSQLPFHYAFLGYSVSLNVFFTLLIGLLTIWGMEEADQRLANRLLAWGGKILLFAAGGLAAFWLNTDYDWSGVMLIVIFYLLYRQRLLSLIAGYLSFLWEAYCLPAFILIWFYNGKRGLRMKYLFYFIYPLHLTLLLLWRYLYHFR